MYISLFCQLRGASKEHRFWFLIPSSHKWNQFLGEMADSRTGAGIIQDGLGTSCTARN